MKRKSMSKENRKDIYIVAKGMNIPTHKVYTIIQNEKLKEPVKITQSKLLRLYKKYYEGGE